MLAFALFSLVNLALTPTLSTLRPPTPTAQGIPTQFAPEDVKYTRVATRTSSAFPAWPQLMAHSQHALRPPPTRTLPSQLVSMKETTTLPPKTTPSVKRYKNTLGYGSLRVNISNVISVIDGQFQIRIKVSRSPRMRFSIQQLSATPIRQLRTLPGMKNG
jgi:hypothetical protein